MSGFFLDRLGYHWSNERSVCVGLDPDLEMIPSQYYKADLTNLLFGFNRSVIDVTKDIVCGYKINPCFYEILGVSGVDAMERTVSHIISSTNALVILDAKYGDVSHTNSLCAGFAFKTLGVDAVTVNPYCGLKSLDPFFRDVSRGVFVFCRSSEDVSDVQDFLVNGEPLYSRVVRFFKEAGKRFSQCAFIVGATHLDALKSVRSAVGDAPILVPGIGAQGGDVKRVLSAAGTDDPGKGLIVTASRSVIFADNVRRKVENLNRYFYNHT